MIYDIKMVVDENSRKGSEIIKLIIFSDMPCMCVPVLEMDGGYRMPETMAICRYLAREFGKYLQI